jgi:hypothetical protein
MRSPGGAGELRAGQLVAAIVRRPDPVPCLNCAHDEWDYCLNGRYTERGITGRHGFLARPPVNRREVQQRFWKKITEGLSTEDAALACGVSVPVGSRWFRDGGGMPPIHVVAQPVRPDGGARSTRCSTSLSMRRPVNSARTSRRRPMTSYSSVPLLLLTEPGSADGSQVIIL